MTGFTIEQLKQVKTILVHKDCSDGFASAIILQIAMPWANVRFIQYGTEEHENLTAGPGLLFCDLSPPINRYKEFQGSLILDHHTTCKNQVEELGGIYNEGLGISGATLAYQYVYYPLKHNEYCMYVNEEIRELADLAGIFDTWHQKDRRWEKAKALAEALRLYPWYSWTEGLLSCDEKSILDQRVEVGELLVNRNDDHAKDVAEHAWKTTLSNGKTLCVIPGIYTVNLVSDVSGTDITIGFNYYIEDNLPKVRLSCRSHCDFDISRFCKFFGGGGHPRSAGCNIEDISHHAHNPFIMVADLLELYIRSQTWE